MDGFEPINSSIKRIAIDLTADLGETYNSHHILKRRTYPVQDGLDNHPAQEREQQANPE